MTTWLVSQKAEDYYVVENASHQHYAVPKPTHSNYGKILTIIYSTYSKNHNVIYTEHNSNVLETQISDDMQPQHQPDTELSIHILYIHKTLGSRENRLCTNFSRPTRKDKCVGKSPGRNSLDAVVCVPTTPWVARCYSCRSPTPSRYRMSAGIGYISLLTRCF